MCGGHLRPGDQLGTAFFLVVLVAAWPCCVLGAEAAQGGDRGLEVEVEVEVEDEDEDEGEGDETPEVDEAVEVKDSRLRRTAAQDVHGSPGSVVAVDLDESIAPAATLADVLDDVAGVHVRRFGGPGDPAWVTIRGSTSRQVEVWVDGVPLNAQGSSAVDLGGLALDAYDRVEVWRGFAPLELGASPIGGVVHLTSRPGAETPPRFEASLGSWQTRRVAAEGGLGGELAGGATGDVRLTVSYAGTEGDFRYLKVGAVSDPDDDEVLERANNDHDQLDVVGRARLVRGPATLTIADQLGWSDGGVPGPRFEQTSESRFGELRNLLSGSATLELHPDADLRGDLSWLFLQERFEDPLGEIGVRAQDTADRHNQPVGGLLLRLRPLPWLELLPSLRTVIDTYEPVDHAVKEGDDAVRFRASTTFTLGASVEPWNGKLAVLPAIGVHLLDNRFLGQVPFEDVPVVGDGEEFVAEAMPRIAVAVRPTDWLTIRAAAGRSFRPPTFLELFGDRGGVIGNPRLRPETAHTLDASVRVAGEPHRMFAGGVEVGYYRSDAVDRIVFRPNGQRVTVPINFGGSTIQGFEAAGHARIARVVVLGAAVTFADSRITQGEPAHLGKRLPYVPTWELDATAGVEFAPWVRATWAFRFTAGTYDSRTNLFLQPPRPLHSVIVRLQPGPRWPWIAVEGHNLGDVTTFVRPRDPLQPSDDDLVEVPVEDFRGNPLAGRSFMVSLGWTFPGGP
jgi:vitamin B12 transporter